MKISILILVIILMGCDENSNNNEQEGKTKTYEEFVSFYNDLMCNNLLNCKQNNLVQDAIMRNEEECKTELSSIDSLHYFADLQRVKAKIDEGSVEYNGEKAVLCLQELQNLECKPFKNLTPESCSQVFTGFVVDGDACEIDSECSSGYCNISQFCPGVCQARLPVGEACESGEKCTFGAACIAGICSAYSGPLHKDDACSSAQDWCEEGLYCSEFTGICQTWLEPGDSCTSWKECGANAYCLGNVYTDIPKTCIEVTEIVENQGGECSLYDGKFCASYAGLSCVYHESIDEPGTCHPPVQLGGVCYDSTNMVSYYCDDGLYCTPDPVYSEGPYLCAEKLNNGETCIESYQCESDLCLHPDGDKYNRSICNSTQECVCSPKLCESYPN